MAEKMWPMDPTGEQLPRGLAPLDTGRPESLSGYDDWLLLSDDDEDDFYFYGEDDNDD